MSGDCSPYDCHHHHDHHHDRHHDHHHDHHHVHHHDRHHAHYDDHLRVDWLNSGSLSAAGDPYQLVRMQEKTKNTKKKAEADDT